MTNFDCPHYPLKPDAVDRCCSQQLGLTDDYVIEYIANTEFPYLLDAEDLLTQFEDEDGQLDVFNFNKTEIRQAIEKRMVSVKLPENYRLVGMRPHDGDEHSPRVYGIVDADKCPKLEKFK